MSARSKRPKREAHETTELRREAYTMAFYVAICVVAALTVVSDDADHSINVIGIVWGTAIGLALAHWFAFRLSTRLVTSGTIGRRDAELGLAQLAGAAAVAVLATVPILLFPADTELEATRIVLSLTIGLAGYVVARSGGASRIRSLIYGTVVLGSALVIAVIKNTLGGH
jgi:hypothetical protein